MTHHPNSSPDTPATGAKTAGRSAKAWLVFLIPAILLLAADLRLKQWSFAHVAGQPVELTRQNSTDPVFWMLHRHEPVTVIPRILALHLTANPGAVFGLGKGNQVFFMVMSLIAAGVIGMAFYRSSAKARIMHLALALILAGALGNLFDRVAFNAVRDMLYLFPDVKLPFGWKWPGGNRELYPWIFNLADVWLLVGISLTVLLSGFANVQRPAPAPGSDRR